MTARGNVLQRVPMLKVLPKEEIEVKIILEEEKELGPILHGPFQEAQRGLTLPFLKANMGGLIDLDNRRFTLIRGR